MLRLISYIYKQMCGVSVCLSVRRSVFTFFYLSYFLPAGGAAGGASMGGGTGSTGGAVKGGVFFFFFRFFWVLPPFLGGGWSGVATRYLHSFVMKARSSLRDPF